MPVKLRKNKAKPHRITPDAAAAFKSALSLRLHREEQISDHTSCPGVADCALCHEYEELVGKIADELKLATWEMSPIDVADCPPPPWFPEREAAAWEAARELYNGLCDAAGVARSTSCEVSDIVRSHNIIRWTERVMRVPEGRDHAKRVRLREFQRELIRKIYGNGFGEDGDDIRKALGIKG